MKKLLSCLLLILVATYPCMFVSYHTLAYSGGKQLTFNPVALFKALQQSPVMQLLFASMMVLLLLLFFLTIIQMSFGQTRVGTREVLPGISTPVPAGQNQYGSSRWMTDREKGKQFTVYRLRKGPTMKYLIGKGRVDLSEAYQSENERVIDYSPFSDGGIIVGGKGKHQIFVNTEDTHTCVIGATRSGKGRTILIPSICLTALSGESIISSDLKGEQFLYCSPFLQRLGYEVIALDFIDPQLSDQYNFAQVIVDCVERNDVTKAKEATWDLVESLVGDTKGEPIWHNGECSVMACCIMIVMYDNRNRPQYQNLTNVYHFMSRMCAPQGGKDTIPLQAYLDTLPDSHPAKSLAGISQVAHFRTRSSFYTSALATLRLFEDWNIASMTAKSNFDIYATGTRKRALFILLPDDRDTYYPVASLFVRQHYQLMTRVARDKGGRLPIRVQCFLDEVGNFAYMKAFQKQITVGGGRGIRFHLFLQDTKQLDETYGQNISSIIRSNCETWIYLQSSDNTVLEELSKKLGNYTTLSPGSSSSSNSSTSMSHSASTSLISRPLLTPEEIQRVQRPYQLVFTNNYPAIMAHPDLSKTVFNKLLGLGSKEHNTKVMTIRQRRRKGRHIKAPDLWGVWLAYESAPMPLPEEPQPSNFEFKFDY